MNGENGADPIRSRSRDLPRSPFLVSVFVLSVVGLMACGDGGSSRRTGGAGGGAGRAGSGGRVGTGGGAGVAGRSGTGGAIGSGGIVGAGGEAAGGATGTGGAVVGSGGTVGSGGAPGSGGSGGSAGTGGTAGAVATGGRANTGGSPATGGAVGTGGSMGTGGAVGTGGSPVGTGGANTGGANTGGANTGGANTGGANTGGANTGGANTGGANTGGANTGGANTGGANTGGANTGGRGTGGANTGGANTGGANTGGAGTGGVTGSGGASMYVVAHPDDDLLFINPHLQLDIQAGKRVQTVFITSGDQDPAWMARETSVMNAHADMAGVASAWTCSTSTNYGGRSPRQCVLNGRPLVTMIFLRLHDGQVRNLLSGSTVATSDASPSYNQAQMTATLGAIQAELNPGRVGTLDATLAHGPEHDDHIGTAILTFDVARSDGAVRQVIMYRGYTMAPPSFSPPPPQAEPANLSAADHAEKARIMVIYNEAPLDADYDGWCARFYPVASQTAGAGQIQSDEGPCLQAAADAAGAAVTAATCAAGALQTWTISGDSRVRGPGGRCLGVSGGNAVIQACGGDPGQRWTLLSNGQLRGTGETCLTRNGTSVTAETCGSDTSGARHFPLVTQRWSP